MEIIIGDLKKENKGTSYVERIVAANAEVIKVPALDNLPATEYKRYKTPVYDAWDVLKQYPEFINTRKNNPDVSEKYEEEEKTDVKNE